MLFWRTDMERSPEDDQAIPKAGIGLLGMVFALFFASIFLFYPAWKTSQAKKWTTTFCRVISSELAQTQSSRSTRKIFKAEIRYLYFFNGKEYESDQVCFLHFGSNHSERPKALVKRFPAGSMQNCFVNPEFPAEAVLDRDFNGNVWIAGFMLLVALFGGIQFVRALKEETW